MGVWKGVEGGGLRPGREGAEEEGGGGIGRLYLFTIHRLGLAEETFDVSKWEKKNPVIYIEGTCIYICKDRPGGVTYGKEEGSVRRETLRDS